MPGRQRRQQGARANGNRGRPKCAPFAHLEPPRAAGGSRSGESVERVKCASGRSLAPFCCRALCSRAAAAKSIGRPSRGAGVGPGLARGAGQRLLGPSGPRLSLIGRRAGACAQPQARPQLTMGRAPFGPERGRASVPLLMGALHLGAGGARSRSIGAPAPTTIDLVARPLIRIAAQARALGLLASI